MPTEWPRVEDARHQSDEVDNHLLVLWHSRSDLTLGAGNPTSPAFCFTLERGASKVQASVIPRSLYKVFRRNILQRSRPYGHVY